MKKWKDVAWPEEIWGMDEIQQVYGSEWAKLVGIVREETCKENLKEDLEKVSKALRPARALALSLAKWLPGALSDWERGFWYNCGACLYWGESFACPLGCEEHIDEEYECCKMDCGAGCILKCQVEKDERSPAEVLNRIVPIYLGEREKALGENSK